MTDCPQDTGLGRSEAEHAICRPRRLHTILNLYECARKKHFVSLKLKGQNLRSPISQTGSFNHCTKAPTSVAKESFRKFNLNAIDQQLIHTQAPQTPASDQLDELCSLPE